MGRKKTNAEKEKFKGKAYSEIDILSGYDFKNNLRLRESEKEILDLPTPMIDDNMLKSKDPISLKHGGMSCPYREGSSKNSIPGNNGIQVKGFKFIGVK